MRIAVLCLFLGVMSIAAPTTGPATTQSSTPADAAKNFPSLKDALGPQLTALDRELAERIMKRQETPAGMQLQLLELKIDVRVVQRWFLFQSISAKSVNESQIVARLRSMELGDAIPLLEKSLPLSANPNRTQVEAMNRLHKLTFELGEAKDAQQIDEVARKVGTELTTISSSTPIDPRSLPRMRPPRARGEVGKTPTGQTTQSIAQLQAEATRVAVSPTLRRQLLALAKAATSGDVKDAAAMHQALADGVELARGLSTSTSFSQESRQQIETQLAEGLALVTDPRTRSAGEKRIQSLDDYRDAMNRIAHSALSAEMRAALAPAFAYAQNHAAESGQVLNLLEDFTDIVSRVESLPNRENPVANLRNSTTEVAKQYTFTRGAAISVANDLSTKGVAALADRINDLRELADLYATLSTMQEIFNVLNTYHPRPFGGLELRAARAAAVAANPAHTPLRAEGIKFLSDLARLARLSDAITQQSLADIPPEVVQSYAGVSTADFSAKVKLLMADLINSAAQGQQADARKIDRLNAVDDLVNALHSAAESEKNFQAVPSLQKWADWSVGADQLRTMLAPYQQIVSSAFAGFMSDAPDAVEKFTQERETFAPMLAFLARDAAYANSCAALPDGLTGDLAKLMTPMHDQPFATERAVSFAVDAWQLLNATDRDGAQRALDYAFAQVQAEMNPKPLSPSTKP